MNELDKQVIRDLVYVKVKPCKICGAINYEFVPHTCDENEILFEIRCKVCDLTANDFYSVKLVG